MSYSFQVKKATKAEALEGVSAELKKVRDSQPVHMKDEAAAVAAARALVGLLADDDTQDVEVRLTGSISSATGVSEVSLNVGARLVSRKAAEKPAEAPSYKPPPSRR